MTGTKLVHKGYGVVEAVGGGAGDPCDFVVALCPDGEERLLSTDPKFWNDDEHTIKMAVLMTQVRRMREVVAAGEEKKRAAVVRNAEAAERMTVEETC